MLLFIDEQVSERRQIRLQTARNPLNQVSDLG